MIRKWNKNVPYDVCTHADSNQPAHPGSHIRIFVVIIKKLHFLAIKNAPSEDSDQTARTRRLIRIFARRTCSEVRCLTLRFISSITKRGRTITIAQWGKWTYLSCLFIYKSEFCWLIEVCFLAWWRPCWWVTVDSLWNVNLKCSQDRTGVVITVNNIGARHVKIYLYRLAVCLNLCA